MPSDPVMLLSYVNTQLRDNYSTLSDFVNSQNIDIKDLTKKLNSINYFYDKKINKFI